MEFQYCYLIHSDDELYHHGVKGMHWGIRRYQNANGSLTPKGRAKLNKYKEKQTKRVTKAYNKIEKRLDKYANKLEAKRDRRIMKTKDTRKIDSRIANVNLNKRINQASLKAAINKTKKMKISDISAVKKQRAAYIAKTSLKTIGKLGIGAAAAFATAGAANVLGASVGMAESLGIGAASGGTLKSISLRPRFTNLTRAEQLKIHKKIQHK